MKFRAFPISEPELQIVSIEPVGRRQIPQEILFDIEPELLDLPKLEYSEPNLGTPGRKETR